MKFVVRSIAVAAVAFCAFGAHAQKGETVKIAFIDPMSGLMAPVGLPADVHKKATSTLMAVLAKPEVREKIQAAGIDLDVEDSAQLAKTIDSEIKKWALSGVVL